MVLFQMKPRRALDVELLAQQFDLAPGILVGRLAARKLTALESLEPSETEVGLG